MFHPYNIANNIIGSKKSVKEINSKELASITQNFFDELKIGNEKYKLWLKLHDQNLWSFLKNNKTKEKEQNK